MLQLTKSKIFITGAVLLLMAIGSAIHAMPPHPDQYEAGQAAGKFQFANSLVQAEELERGINAPSALNSPAKANASGTYKFLTVLIEFSDQVNTVQAEFFDTLVYGGELGNVAHYYNTISEGNLDIVTIQMPSDLGWQTAPQTYAYYVNNERGTGSYPNNTQKLCEDIANIIDPLVDFSLYDNDGNGYVDGLIMIHTGTGAEFSGEDSDIHSHKWGTLTPQSHDGVYVYEYSIQPEYWLSGGDMTCGVICHELGHVFGLPDLYDTDYTSRGVGLWSLMASGSWGGPGYNGSRPSAPDAWCMLELGFKTATNVTANANDVSIQSIRSGGPIFRVWTSGLLGSEYYLVENRQQTGYDQYLPGSGLLIWHIDETQMSGWTINDNEWYPGHTSSGNYAVALEQADGLFELEKYINAGNSGDPFPGSSSTTIFSSLSTPNSNAYNGDDTYVVISDISPSGTVMTADFQISLLADVGDDEFALIPDQFELLGNYPNPFNPATNFQFSLPGPSNVEITVFNILGQIIETIHEFNVPAGNVTISWHTKSNREEDLPSGLYFYHIETEFGADSDKMLLLK